MNVAPRKPWTQDEFLAWVVHQEGRYEFDGVRPVDMNGGTVNHAQMIQNLHAALRMQLRGTSFRVLGPSVGVATVNGAVRYPDAVVFSGKVDCKSLLVPNVSAVFEILSPSTRRADRNEKVVEYGSVPSILHYGWFDSETVSATVYSRATGQAAWEETSISDLAGSIDLPAIAAAILVSSLYEDIELTNPG